jgi:hypothetical protein
MDATSVAAGLGAVLTGGAGVFLIVNEYRRKDRRVAKEALETYSDELYDLGQAYVELRRYDFEVRKLLADAGIDTPPPPKRAHTPEPSP